jgi:TolB-like protein/DNA-binding winged helix-turn-helix (wHTH) protein/Flp pilus assembly protein TadD
MERTPPQQYVFDRFKVDLGRACLLRDGEEVSLRPKAFDALKYLVENRGRLATKEELIRALWPNVIVTDDSLVKCIQEVRDALQDQSRRYLKTVPRRGYIFDALVVEGNQIQIVAAVTETSASSTLPAAPVPVPAPAPLADEPAPSNDDGAAGSRGLRGTDAAQRRHGRGRLAWLTAAGVLAVASVGIGAYLLLSRDDSSSSRSAESAGLDSAAAAAERPLAPVQSVAVLPFVSISADPEQDYFSDGISEELLNALASIPGLQVPSRTSSFTFKNSNVDLRTIATALGVDHVLEGSVRKAGTQVRITAQLIDVATDSRLWSATYDHELDDVFAIQDEIAANVADALQIELLGGRLADRSASRTENVEAHDAYLLGLHYRRTKRSEDFFRARDSFQRAIDLDSDYAAAHAWLASTLVDAQGYGVIDLDEALDGAERAAADAIRIDPDASEAHYARGDVALGRADFAAADASFRRAIELNPNLAEAYERRSITLSILDRPEEALTALQKALDLDPLNGLFNWRMGNLELVQGNVSQARVYYRRAVEFEPSQPNAYAGLGDVAVMSGRLDEALLRYLEGLEWDPGQVHMTAIVGLVYRSLGDVERAQLWFDKASQVTQVGSLPRFFRDFSALMIRNEAPNELIAVLRGIPRGQFGPLSSRLFRKAALGTRDRAGIESFYRQSWPELFAPEPLVNASNFAVATDVAWLAMADGQANRADRLLTEAVQIFRNASLRPMVPPEWALVMFETEAFALQGRKSEALAALRRAIDAGWRWDWWQVENDPTLDSISDDPQFAAMIEEVKADLAVQLDRVLEMERSGEIRTPADTTDVARATP